MSLKKFVTPEHPAMIDIPRPLFPLGLVVGTPVPWRRCRRLALRPANYWIAM